MLKPVVDASMWYADKDFHYDYVRFGFSGLSFAAFDLRRLGISSYKKIMDFYIGQCLHCIKSRQSM